METHHTVATGQISVIFRVLKIWVWKSYLTKVIEYNLILYTILEVAWFLRIVYKSSHKKLFSISNHNFKHRCRITWNWQLFNHFVFHTLASGKLQTFWKWHIKFRSGIHWWLYFLWDIILLQFEVMVRYNLVEWLLFMFR